MAINSEQTSVFTPEDNRVALAMNGQDMFTNKTGPVSHFNVVAANEEDYSADDNLFSLNNNSEKAKRNRASGHHNVKGASTAADDYADNKQNSVQRFANATLIAEELEDLNQQIWKIDERLDAIGERRAEIAVRQDQIHGRLGEIDQETAALESENEELEKQEEKLDAKVNSIQEENVEATKNIEQEEQNIAQTEVDKMRSTQQLLSANDENSIQDHANDIKQAQQKIELSESEIAKNKSIIMGSTTELEQIEFHKRQIAEQRTLNEEKLEGLKQEKEELVREQQKLAQEDNSLEGEEQALNIKKEELQAKIDELDLKAQGLEGQTSTLAQTYNVLNSLDEEKLRKGGYTNQEVYDQLPESMKPIADNFIRDTVQSESWLTEHRPELLPHSSVNLNENKFGIKNDYSDSQSSGMYDGDTTNKVNQSSTNSMADLTGAGYDANGIKLGNSFNSNATKLPQSTQSPTTPQISTPQNPIVVAAEEIKTTTVTQSHPGMGL